MGNTGNLLLDPFNITVSVSGSTNLSTVDQFLDGCGSSCFSGESQSINVSAINSATTNVELQAYENINFNTAVSISTLGVGLTARAGKHINVDASMSTNNGVIRLSADDSQAWQGANAGTGLGAITVAGPATISSGGAAIFLESNQRSYPVGKNLGYGTAIVLAAVALVMVRG